MQKLACAACTLGPGAHWVLDSFSCAYKHSCCDSGDCTAHTYACIVSLWFLPRPRLHSRFVVLTHTCLCTRVTPVLRTPSTSGHTKDQLNVHRILTREVLLATHWTLTIFTFKRLTLISLHSHFLISSPAFTDTARRSL